MDISHIFLTKSWHYVTNVAVVEYPDERKIGGHGFKIF